MVNQKPVFLIVHGGYFLPNAWQPFMSSLEAAGFESHCPRLPTCGDIRPPMKTKADDVAVIRKAAEDLVSAGKRVIVLAHSYGGIPASEAIEPAFYVSKNSGTVGAGVVHMIFLSAWLIPPSNNAGDVVGRHGMQTHVALQVNEDGTATASNAPDCFYNDPDGNDVVPRSQGEAWARNFNVTHNYANAMAGENDAGQRAWIDVPSTFVLCTADESLLPPMQRGMVDDARAAIKSSERSTEMVLREIRSGHCAFLTRPDELFKIVTKIAGGVSA